jgi:hypothetical protein
MAPSRPAAGTESPRAVRNQWIRFVPTVDEQLKMRGMQSDARNMLLRRLLGMVLSVADDWMAERRKLHPDLILQRGHDRENSGNTP